MKTIKAKNGEWVNLSNHLPTLTKVEGKQFAVAIADNILKLRESLKHLDGILAATPEFGELAQKMKVYENKTDKKSLAAIEKLKKANAKVIEDRQKQIDDVNLILAEEFEIEVTPITQDMYPENITAEQIIGLQILR
tara:strand:+ start:631 stop:1041 length:411 start_codon:yes stop_codon:yes gene_type:complete